LPSALVSREAKQKMCVSCGEVLSNLRLNAHTLRKNLPLISMHRRIPTVNP